MFNNLFGNIDISNPAAMLPLVAGTGFLDGIHPCAIAILIFFIFLTYLTVGVGLMSGIIFFGQPHFFAKLGSWLLIVLGLINIKDYFFPKLPIHLSMPKVSSP